MAAIKYILIILHVSILVVAAETALSFFVPEERIATLNKAYGEQAVKRLNSLLDMMDTMASSPEDKIVVAVNRFFNQLEFSPDLDTWQKKTTGPAGWSFSERDRAIAKILPSRNF